MDQGSVLGVRGRELREVGLTGRTANVQIFTSRSRKKNLALSERFEFVGLICNPARHTFDMRSAQASGEGSEHAGLVIRRGVPEEMVVRSSDVALARTPFLSC